MDENGIKSTKSNINGEWWLVRNNLSINPYRISKNHYRATVYCIQEVRFLVGLGMKIKKLFQPNFVYSLTVTLLCECTYIILPNIEIAFSLRIKFLILCFRNNEIICGFKPQNLEESFVYVWNVVMRHMLICFEDMFLSLFHPSCWHTENSFQNVC